MILEKVPLDIQASWREEIKRFLATHDHATEDRQAAIQLIFDNSSITLTPVGLDEFLAGDRLEAIEDRHGAKPEVAPRKLRKRSVLFLSTLTLILVLTLSVVSHLFKRWTIDQKHVWRGLIGTNVAPQTVTSPTLTELTATRDEVAQWPEISVTLRSLDPAKNTEERSRYYIKNHRASPLVFIKAKWTTMPGVQSKVSNYTDLVVFNELSIDPPLATGQDRFLTEGQSFAEVTSFLDIWEAIYADGTKEVSKKYKNDTLNSLTAQITEERARLAHEAIEEVPTVIPSR